MTGIGVGPNTPGVLAVVGALGTNAGPLPHPPASSAKEAPMASRVMMFLVIEDMFLVFVLEVVWVVVFLDRDATIMAVVVDIVGTEGALGKHRHHVAVHPVGDCDTERVATHHRRPIVEPGVDACGGDVLDDLVQARVVPRNAGKAGAGGRDVDGIAAEIVLDGGDGGRAQR